MKTTARGPDGMPPIAMRNPLRIGPGATRPILPLLRPAVLSGDGARVPVGMPPGDTQSFANRCWGDTRDRRSAAGCPKAGFLLGRHASSPVGHQTLQGRFSSCSPAVCRRTGGVTGLAAARPRDALHPRQAGALPVLDVPGKDSARYAVDGCESSHRGSECTNYGGRQQAQFVLELGGGEAKRPGLHEGDTLDF